MKRIFNIAACTACLALAVSSCISMDLTPKSQGSSLSWYTTETELEQAAREFYILGYWKEPFEEMERWSDNFTYRNTNRAVILDGNIDGKTWQVYAAWQQSYKLVARANTMLENIHRAEEAGVAESVINRYKAEARFCRACKYGDLMFFFGDVPYMEGTMTITDAENMGRTPKAEVKEKMYEDFDFAAEYLPVSYTGLQHATKGAALAMKARYALFFGDYSIAAEAAKACMDLKVYSLESDYSKIFDQNAGVLDEKIFYIPRSISNSIVLDQTTVNNTLPRNAGGYAAYNPSWDLLASYLCTDGLPIDESPLFNPREPFKNRDPRCTMTIVEFGTMHCGVTFDPCPTATKVSKSDGTTITNNDTRAVNQYASFNGLLQKKGVDETWLDNGKQAAPDYLMMRYADVLLMYAEAKIELGDIDDSVRDAINQVRARAYGVGVASTSFYPAVTASDQATLRKAVRIERRMELALEGLRYYDLIRWKLASKALNSYNYITLYTDLKEKVVDKGLWFWAMTPAIDEDGLADFSALFDAGYCQQGAKRVFPDRQYLFPVPTHDMELCPNLAPDNEGY